MKCIFFFPPPKSFLPDSPPCLQKCALFKAGITCSSTLVFVCSRRQLGLRCQERPWRQSAINSEAYLVQGRNHFSMFQKKPACSSLTFSWQGLPLPKANTAKRTPKEVITVLIALQIESFFLLDSDPGIVSPLNPREQFAYSYS